MSKYEPLWKYIKIKGASLIGFPIDYSFLTYKKELLEFGYKVGKNLTFKTGGVDANDCAEILSLIEQGKIDTTPLITHKFPLAEIEEAYRIFENKLDGVIKVAICS